MRVLFMLPAAEGVYPQEAADRRKRVISSYATPALDIDIVYQPEASGFDPWGGAAHPDKWRHAMRAHELGARVAQWAQEEGYDAFCPFGLVDVGIEAGRSLGLTIPLCGAAESSALICGLLGRRFARCHYVMTEASAEREKIRTAKWGLEHLYVGDTGIGIDNSEYPQRRDEVLERFVACTRQAKELGAEVMGMVGMSLCPVEFSAADLYDASGMPVVDGIAAQLTVAGFWHRTGLPPSLLKVPR